MVVGEEFMRFVNDEEEEEEEVSFALIECMELHGRCKTEQTESRTE